MVCFVALLAFSNPQSVVVQDVAELRNAAAAAQPGTTILLAPGDYQGGIHLSNIHGAANARIRISAQDPTRKPRIIGGGSGLQLSAVSFLDISDLVITDARGNGLNIDDGGKAAPSRHVTITNILVQRLPKGNHDAIKLSGLEDFQVSQSQVEDWGGSGIDMVGCHRGVIDKCTFQRGGDNGVQAKGGSSQITISGSRFTDAGQRGINLGGSTGREFFRPPLHIVPAGQRVEAKAITVENCVFSGSMAPIAFVGSEQTIVRNNTIYNPGRWALRILQETRELDFKPCQRGEFSNNIVAFRSDRWASGGVNIGPGTLPETFLFKGNLWYCLDQPSRSRPTLPSPETGGTYGQDPQLADPERGNFLVNAKGITKKGADLSLGASASGPGKRRS